jgi:hypothetical protein
MSRRMKLPEFFSCFLLVCNWSQPRCGKPRGKISCVLMPVNAFFMTLRTFISSLLLVAVASVFGSNTYACEPPTILAPSEDQVLHTSRPVIAWLSSAGADVHEVDVIARIPEGEVHQRLQRNVRGRQWQPDIGLATRDAVISLRVSRRCADGRTASTERRFHLNNSESCPTPAYLSPTRVDRFWRVEWKISPPIKMLELRNFFGDGATPGESITTDRSPALLQISGQKKEVVGLRAHCGEGLSEWVWLPVASP